MSIDNTNLNRRNTPDGTKGNTDVSSGTESEKGGLPSFMGRRKFLALGGAGAVVAVSSVGVATALIRAGGSNPTPRSPKPVGLDPATGRNDGAIPAPTNVRYLAFAGTDGWATMPLGSQVGGANGAAAIDPYFPDPLADPGKNTYVFSFRNVTGLNRSQVAAQKGHTQLCAPLVYSTVGEEIWITLTNLGLVLRPDLTDGHTVHWHGFRNAIPFYDGVPESSISVPIGHDFTYVYRPKDAGTYMYHCHFEDVEHVTMGMQGIVFVKPAASDTIGLGAGQQKAYGVADGDAAGETRYDREYGIMLGEIDSRAHFNDCHIMATDWTDFHADFHTMNGRAYPDTLEPNSTRDADGNLHAQTVGGTDAAPIYTPVPNDGSPADRLSSNPLSSLVQARPGDRVLIRFANLGFHNRSIVFPGLEVDVLGRDARYVPASAQRKATDTIQIGPGESRDVFFTAPASGTFPFYDRSMSHYTGSADGSDAWVGGQRSEIRVIPGLAAQLKPNGWGGETLFHGEQALLATHTNPVVTASGFYQGGNGPTSGRFLQGTVAADPDNTVTDIWYVRANPDPNSNTAPPVSQAPLPGAPSWLPAAVAPTSPYNFNIRVAAAGNANFNRHWYWVIARDDAGFYSAPVPVRI